MNPEDKELLLRTAKLAEDNNKMLQGISRTMRWSQIWGFVKIIIFVIPFIIGYFYLEPYLGSVSGSLSEFQSLLR